MTKKWIIYYEETVTKYIEVEAPDRMSALQKYVNKTEFDNATVAKRGIKREFITAEEVKD